MATGNSDTTLARSERGLTLAMVTEMTGYDLPRIALVRTQMARSMNVTAEQVSLQDLAMFLNAERSLGLDSLLRQIHWMSRGGKGGIQVGIDGYRAVAERTNVYAGSEPPRFGAMIEQDYVDGQDRKTMLVPEKASVVVWKIVAGHKAAFTGEAYWTEFYPGQREGFMYRKMPRHMLAKDAEAQALRKAFPAQLSSVEYASAADYSGQELIEVNPPERRVDQKALAAKHDAINMTEEELDHAADPPPSSRSELWAENRRLVEEAGSRGITAPTLNNRATDEAIRKTNADLRERISTGDWTQPAAVEQEALV